MLIFTQCANDSSTEEPLVEETPVDSDEPQGSNSGGENEKDIPQENYPDEENTFCTDIYKHVSLQLRYYDGRFVLLDSSKVHWVSQNRFLEQNSVSWNEARAWGNYTIVDDGMRKELEGKQEIMRFTGYLKGEIVCEHNVLVGADRCHVNYLGMESLTIVMGNISDYEQGNSEEFCLHLNTAAEMDKTIPVINEFLAGLPSRSSERPNLEVLTAWLKLYPCISDATILCVWCIKTGILQSEISISVNKNGKTEDYILDILMSNPLKAIRFHDHY